MEKLLLNQPPILPRQACLERGLFTRAIGDILAFAPPLVISEDEVDQIVTIVREALEAVAG